MRANVVQVAFGCWVEYRAKILQLRQSSLRKMKQGMLVHCFETWADNVAEIVNVRTYITTYASASYNKNSAVKQSRLIDQQTQTGRDSFTARVFRSAGAGGGGARVHAGSRRPRCRL